jgi:hypothetical protein
MELFNMSSALGIVSRIVGITDDPYLKFTVTHIVGDDPDSGSSGFYIHSKKPIHAYLVQVTSIPDSQLPPEVRDIYRRVNIECYVAGEDVVVYPISMYPGCDIFKQFFDVGKAARLGEFVKSGLGMRIMEYMFSYTKIAEFRKEHPELYEGS